MKERITIWLIRKLLKLIPYYGIAYRENIAEEGQRVYKARKRRKDVGRKGAYISLTKTEMEE